MAKPKVYDYKMIKKKPWSSIPAPATTLMKSVTLYEIDEFWRRKRMDEEEHLLAAEKAAARIKARSFKERDYKLFEEGMLSILEDGGDADDGDDSKDLLVGIKDWWTKSKYAYLNQPAIKFMEKNAMLSARGGTSTYTPQKVYSFYTSREHQQFTISSLGVH